MNRRWMFTYHFPHALVKFANQSVMAEATSWWAAAAKADREVRKRKGIKGIRTQDMFRRACYPIKEGMIDVES